MPWNLWTTGSLQDSFASSRFVSDWWASWALRNPIAVPRFTALLLFGHGSKWVKMGQNGSKWVKMGQNGSKWVKMGQNGSKWVKQQNQIAKKCMADPGDPLGCALQRWDPILCTGCRPAFDCGGAWDPGREGSWTMPTMHSIWRFWDWHSASALAALAHIEKVDEEPVVYMYFNRICSLHSSLCISWDMSWDCSMSHAERSIPGWRVDRKCAEITLTRCAAQCSSGIHIFDHLRTSWSWLQL